MNKLKKSLPYHGSHFNSQNGHNIIKSTIYVLKVVTLVQNFWILDIDWPNYFSSKHFSLLRKPFSFLLKTFMKTLISNDIDRQTSLIGRKFTAMITHSSTTAVQI